MNENYGANERRLELRSRVNSARLMNLFLFAPLLIFPTHPLVAQDLVMDRFHRFESVKLQPVLVPVVQGEFSLLQPFETVPLPVSGELELFENRVSPSSGETQWKKGALVGGIVGVALAISYMSGGGMFGDQVFSPLDVVVGVALAGVPFATIGALIGGMFPKW